MGGVDAIVFTGGIGENSPDVRAESCKGLEFLGVSIDAEKNNSADKEKVISSDSSRVKVFALPTNEELVIALDTMRIVDAASHPSSAAGHGGDGKASGEVRNEKVDSAG